MSYNGSLNELFGVPHSISNLKNSKMDLVTSKNSFGSLLVNFVSLGSFNHDLQSNKMGLKHEYTPFKYGVTLGQILPNFTFADNNKISKTSKITCLHDNSSAELISSLEASSNHSQGQNVSIHTHKTTQCIESKTSVSRIPLSDKGTPRKHTMNLNQRSCLSQTHRPKSGTQCRKPQLNKDCQLGAGQQGISDGFLQDSSDQIIPSRVIERDSMLCKTMSNKRDAVGKQYICLVKSVFPNSTRPPSLLFDYPERECGILKALSEPKCLPLDTNESLRFNHSPELLNVISDKKISLCKCKAQNKTSLFATSPMKSPIVRPPSSSSIVRHSSSIINTTKDNASSMSSGISQSFCSVCHLPPASLSSASRHSRVILVPRKKSPRALFKITNAVRFRVFLAAMQRGGLREVQSTSASPYINIVWGGVPNEMSKVRNYAQKMRKTNHFLQSWSVGRKDNLARHIQSAARRHNGFADILPKTWILPNDAKEFEFERSSFPNALWIRKPRASSCGRGIRVIGAKSKLNLQKQALLQRYLADPFLIGNKKFDLRLYVLVTSWDPLRIYVFDEGLVRFATQPYSLSKSALKDVGIHLTNFSVNKKLDNYIKSSNVKQVSTAEIDGSIEGSGIQEYEEDEGDVEREEEGNEIDEGNLSSRSTSSFASVSSTNIHKFKRLVKRRQDKNSSSSFVDGAAPIVDTSFSKSRATPNQGASEEFDEGEEASVKNDCDSELSDGLDMEDECFWENLSKNGADAVSISRDNMVDDFLFVSEPADTYLRLTGRSNADHYPLTTVEKGEVPSKWSFASLQQYLKDLQDQVEEGDSARRQLLDWGRIRNEIDDLIVKTLIAVEPQMTCSARGLLPAATVLRNEIPSNTQRPCFEIYGFDVILDSKLKPWLLEVNVAPSLNGSSVLDRKIKTSMLCDAFTTVGIHLKTKKVLSALQESLSSSYQMILQPSNPQNKNVSHSKESCNKKTMTSLSRAPTYLPEVPSKLNNFHDQRNLQNNTTANSQCNSVSNTKITQKSNLRNNSNTCIRPTSVSSTCIPKQLIVDKQTKPKYVESNSLSSFNGGALNSSSSSQSSSSNSFAGTTNTFRPIRSYTDLRKINFLSELSALEWIELADSFEEFMRKGSFKRIFPTAERVKSMGPLFDGPRNSTVLHEIFFERGGARVFDPFDQEVHPLNRAPKELWLSAPLGTKTFVDEHRGIIPTTFCI